MRNNLTIRKLKISNSLYLRYKNCCNKDENKNYCKWIPLSSTIFTLIILACCEFHRRHPWNYIALVYFTCSASVFLAHVAFDIEMIFFASIIFASSIVGLTLFACQTKFKYTIYTGLGTVLICDIISFLILFATNTTLWLTYLYAEILATVFLLVSKYTVVQFHFWCFHFNAFILILSFKKDSLALVYDYFALQHL